MEQGCKGTAAGTPIRPRMPAWVAGPFFIVGVFFLAYVALGMAYLNPSLRLIAGALGLALVVASGRGLAHPWSAGFFWAGAFWAYAARILHPLAPVAGIAVAVAGALAYYLSTRRGRSMSANQ
jgi:hypothetical protein